MRLRRLSLVATALALTACSSPPPGTSPAAAAPTTQEFTFQIQGGQTIVARTERGPVGNQQRVVAFTPSFERTDGNVYQAALETLMNLNGKERGLFRLQDARMRPEPGLAGNAICWKIGGPDADYCVLPVRDQTTGRITGLNVLVK